VDSVGKPYPVRRGKCPKTTVASLLICAQGTSAAKAFELTLDVKENQREYLGMKKATAVALGKLNLRKLSVKRHKKIARLAIERRWRKARAHEKKARRQYD